jgi:hypothetical protein
MVTTENKWVGFREAIRIVMLTKCDSDLVAHAHDLFLKCGGRPSYLPAFMSDDDCRMFFAALDFARWFLNSVLSEGRIAGMGRHWPEPGRRPITEWSSYYIDLNKGELSNRPGTDAADFPRITGVRISVEDLRRELVGYGSQPTTSRWRKRRAAKQAIEALGYGDLAVLPEKNRFQTIIDKAAECGTSISFTLVGTVWREVTRSRELATKKTKVT